MKKQLLLGASLFSLVPIAAFGQAANPVNVQAMSMGGNPANINPFGEFAVTQTPQNLFRDTFDSAFDTVYNWNPATASGGGVTVAEVGGGGGITLGTGTTALGYSYATGRQTYPLVQPGFIITGVAMKITTSIPANVYAAWGAFTPQTAPSVATSILEGCAFELQPSATSGTAKMYVACYAGGSRTQIVDLSSSGVNKQPTDGVTHTYYTYLAGDRMYWAIDGQGPSSVVNVQNNGINGPNVNTQQPGLLAVAASTSPLASLTLNVAAVWVAATANRPIAIGITPIDHTIVSSTGTSTIVLPAYQNRHSMTIQNTGNANCGINPTGGTAVIGSTGTLTLAAGLFYTPAVPTLSPVAAICSTGQPLFVIDN